jgi:hypothetical protein
MGTPKPGGVKAGTIPSAATMPAKIAMSARSREELRGARASAAAFHDWVRTPAV